MFELLKNKERVSIWLYENTAFKMEGVIIGFDEYMNVTLDNAEEIHLKSNERKPLGRILLKGDCITLVHRVSVDPIGDFVQR
jgi:small nuclear ribonucleoprotein E